MNQVVQAHAKPKLLQIMADKVQMDPSEFQKAVQRTCMPEKHTTEQFGAFMVTANKYGLDPLLKEIYAFPAKGGGIVPIVSIDGWLKMINSHPQFDGMDTEYTHNDAGALVSCKCTIFRKDRSRPIIVEEFLSECKRNTDPWKMEHRMLRHKATIQCGRYAFSFAGVYDEEEGAAIRDSNQEPPAPPPIDAEFEEVAQSETSAPEPVAPVRGAPPPAPQSPKQPVAQAAATDGPPPPPAESTRSNTASPKVDVETDLLTAADIGGGQPDILDELESCRTDLGGAKDLDQLNQVWDHYKELFSTAPSEVQEEADRAYNENFARLK